MQLISLSVRPNTDFKLPHGGRYQLYSTLLAVMRSYDSSIVLTFVMEYTSLLLPHLNVCEEEYGRGWSKTNEPFFI